MLDTTVCIATLKSGSPCPNKVKNGNLCGIHGKKKEVNDCPICFDVINKCDNSKLHCGHCFHKKCLNKWFENQKNTCPICRVIIPGISIVHQTVEYLPVVTTEIFETIRMHVRIVETPYP